MKFFASLHSVIGLKTCVIVSFEQVSRPSIIIGPAARAFFRPEEDLRRAWGNVCGKGMALIMSLDPLDLPVLFVCLFFFFSSQLNTYFIVSKETPVQKCWYWRPTRKLLPINQPIRGRTKLKSRLDYPCFQVSNRGDYFQFTQSL